MSIDPNTEELAKVYKEQGYNEDAERINAALGKPAEKETFTAQSVDTDIDQNPEHPSPGTDQENKPDTIADLLEEWLRLLVVQRRLKTFKQIQARLE